MNYQLSVVLLFLVVSTLTCEAAPQKQQSVVAKQSTAATKCVCPSNTAQVASPFLSPTRAVDIIAPQQSQMENLIDSLCGVVKQQMVQYRFFPPGR